MNYLQRNLVFVLLAVNFLFSALDLKAQEKYWDVIMLKNAEVIRGTIIKTIPNQSVTILAGDSLSRTIPNANIELITKEIKRTYYTQSTEKPDKHSREAGKEVYYQGIILAGYRLNMEKGSYNTLSFNFINGIGLGQLASIGFGVGIRVPATGGEILFPLFLDIRGSLSRKKVAPLIAFGFGKTLYKSSSDSNDSDWKFIGSMVYAALGVRVGWADQSNVMFTLGLEKFDVDGRGLDANMLTLNAAVAL